MDFSGYTYVCDTLASRSDFEVHLGNLPAASQTSQPFLPSFLPLRYLVDLHKNNS